MGGADGVGAHALEGVVVGLDGEGGGAGPGCVLGGVVDELGDDAYELLADARADAGVVEQVGAVGSQVGVSVREGFPDSADGVSQGWWG